jgi:lipoprotein-releasing system permease protein
VIRGRGWLVAEERVQPVELVGFEGPLPSTFPGAAGSAEGVYLGESLAARWGLAPGERVTVVSPRPTLTPFGPQPRARSLPLAGTFESAPTEERQRLALPLEAAIGLLGRPALALEVAAGGLQASGEVAHRLARALPPGARVRTWRELNRPLLFALALEKLMAFVAVSLVVGVASLALVADLALLIASKQAEIGMLQALGATPRSIRTAFLCLGALLAALGGTAGTLLGTTAAWVLDTYRLVPVPGQAFFIDYVPFVIRLRDLLAIGGLTAVLALAAASYAARRATLLTPVEALAR